MNYTNEIEITLMAKSENESFSRSAVAAFVSQLDPTLSEIADIKTAVSEAVSNSIIHGYENNKDFSGKIHIKCRIDGNLITITIKDTGLGIADIEKAREPLYTSKPELERSGMGFTVMETFMDSVIVHSEKGVGTEIIMSKRLNDKQ